MDYRVTVKVTRLVGADEMDADDRQDPFLVDGGEMTYRISAGNEESAREKALDQFHGEVAIGCLDDFEIEVETQAA